MSKDDVPVTEERARAVKLQPYELTFLAEELGRRTPVPVRYLEVLARHPSPLVREGVVYGLGLGLRAAAGRARLALRRIAATDPHFLVRRAAREAMEP